jgi:uncharacterized protein
MKNETVAPEQMIAALFEGKPRLESMALLGRLEYGGGAMYRAWAASERNEKAREQLLAAADREDANGKLLLQMSTFKNECEKCHTPVARDSSAESCSFQCTFCAACAWGYQHVCPNCGGELAPRPAA